MYNTHQPVLLRYAVMLGEVGAKHLTSRLGWHERQAGLGRCDSPTKSAVLWCVRLHQWGDHRGACIPLAL